MARNYGLAAQLNCLNYCHLCKERTGAGSSPRWILADLSRDKVQSLQKNEGEKEMGQPGWQGFVEEVIACFHVFTNSNVDKTRYCRRTTACTRPVSWPKANHILTT